jgi:hypothetical protein
MLALVVSQVAVKVVSLSTAPQPARQALMREAAVIFKVSRECRHTCQYKGVTVKDNKFCLVMKGGHAVKGTLFPAQGGRMQRMYLSCLSMRLCVCELCQKA